MQTWHTDLGKVQWRGMYNFEHNKKASGEEAFLCRVIQINKDVLLPYLIFARFNKLS
jgi:hypothetical protein